MLHGRFRGNGFYRNRDKFLAQISCLQVKIESGPEDFMRRNDLFEALQESLSVQL